MATRRCSYAGMQQQSQCALANGGSEGGKRGPAGASNIDLLRSALYNHQQQQPNQRQQAPSRRTSRSSDVSADMVCSQQSVLNVMDRFVKAVNNMDATVLVPSRLRDMDVTGSAETGPSAAGTGVNNPLYFKGDLHSCFTMLHEAKNALLWGPSSPPVSHSPSLLCYSSSGVSTYGSQGSAYHSAALRVPSVTSQPSHKRQASNGSLGSAASSDPETDNDSSSLSDFADGPVPEGGPENAPDSVEPTESLSNAFRVHLNALYSILQQMADSADYLSIRYQHELEPSSR